MSRKEGPADLNLPDGIRTLYQRRYSAPTGVDWSRPGEVDMNAHVTRRHSLASVGELRDTSSLTVRLCVEALLSGSPATSQKLPCPQSARVKGKPVTAVGSWFENPITDRKTQRRSFSSKVSQITSQSRDQQRSVRTDSKKRAQSGHPAGSGFEVCDVNQTCDPTGQSLFFAPLKRPSQYDDLDQEILPKCSYRLRPNGAIASELAGHIKFNDSKITYESRENSSNTPTSRRPKDIEKNKRIRTSEWSLENYPKPENFQPRSRTASTLSQYTNEHRGSVELRSDPVMTNSPDVPYDADQKLVDSFSEVSAAQFRCFGGLGVLGRRASSASLTSVGSRDRLPKRRDSVTHFEIVGTTKLHGSPEYSGRLRLMPCRAVRFVE